MSYAETLIGVVGIESGSVIRKIDVGKGDWGTIDEEFVKRVEEFLKLQSIIIECPECGSSICDWMLDSITTREENNYLCAKCGYRYTETFEEQDKRDNKNKEALKAFWADILR